MGNKRLHIAAVGGDAGSWQRWLCHGVAPIRQLRRHGPKLSLERCF